MNPVCLDPLIEGYLDYQMKVRRSAQRSIVDTRVRTSDLRDEQRLSSAE